MSGNILNFLDTLAFLLTRKFAEIILVSLFFHLYGCITHLAISYCLLEINNFLCKTCHLSANVFVLNRSNKNSMTNSTLGILYLNDLWGRTSEKFFSSNTSTATANSTIMKQIHHISLLITGKKT